jgi:2-polyprenyl-6-methoxyphenol hydroxylase-like FAD-dependent oxidoreductase
MADDTAGRGPRDGLRVAVIGAGLGGLCLAQGLLRGGADVRVYERDHAVSARRQGYRLHLDARGGTALRDCLPPELFELVLATSGRPGRRFTTLTERLRVLSEIVGDPALNPDDPATLTTSVNRLTLRELLLSGLGDRVLFGCELARYEQGPADVTAHFSDGTTASADVLVGADGVHSAVRRQYLPQAQVEDTGSRCVYGKTPLDSRALSLVPAPMNDGFTAIIGDRVGMAAGLVRFREPPDQAASRVPGLRLSPAQDYLMWAVSAQAGQFPLPDEEMGTLDATALHQVAHGMLRGWHPDLRELVARADVDETFLIRVRTSRPVAAWTPTRVTVLGDAIHAMSPARGSGANIALRDAAQLSAALLAASPGAEVAAIGAYEQQMREYGFAAVAASREAERGHAARRNRLLFWLYNRFGPRPAPAAAAE